MDKVQLWCCCLFLSGVIAWLNVNALPALAKQPVAALSQRPSSVRSAKRVATASWYGKQFHGRRTAAGSVFDSLRLTAAHRTLEFGSMVRVTDLRSGKSVIV